MKKQCEKCGSSMLNIDPDDKLCDTCYWKARYSRAAKVLIELEKYIPKIIQYGLGEINEKPDK